MKKKTSFWILLLPLLFAISACDNYTVPVEDEPEGEVNVTLSPDETLIFTAAEGQAEITVLTNMDNSKISIAVKKEEKEEDTWCWAELVGNKVKVSVSENLLKKSRATVITVKVFSVTKTIDVQQEAPQGEDPIPIEGVYKIAVPSIDNFESTKIYKVMDGTTKVAEICLEYLHSQTIQSRAVVVYAGQGDAADYENGFVAYLVDAGGTVSTQNVNGGKAAFDYDDNTLTYLPGTSAAVTTVYLSEAGITKEAQEGAEDATAEPYFVNDICDNSYPVVKVGAEVWLGSNLRTTKFGDGTEIDLITDDEIPDYLNNIPFIMYSTSTDGATKVETYGLWYNPICVTGENEDLLASSIVDGIWRVSTGGGDNNSGVNGSSTDWQRLFKYVGENQLGTLLATGYSWKNGGAGEFDAGTVSNITGLTIVPAGQRYNITGDGFVIGANVQAFFFYGRSSGRGYNLAESDARCPDQAGVREWPHNSDACNIRLVRDDDR